MKVYWCDKNLLQDSLHLAQTKWRLEKKDCFALIRVEDVEAELIELRKLQHENRVIKKKLEELGHTIDVY